MLLSCVMVTSGSDKNNHISITIVRNNSVISGSLLGVIQ